MSSPALLLIHGYPFDHALWGWVTPLLDKNIHVLTPDLRGFNGDSPGPDDPSLEQMADDLDLLLREHAIKRSVVAGMSMGGYVALAFAERFPARVLGFGLISSQAAADTDEARTSRRAMVEKVQREGVDVAIQAVIPKLFAPENSDRSELIRFPMEA